MWLRSHFNYSTFTLLYHEGVTLLQWYLWMSHLPLQPYYRLVLLPFWLYFNLFFELCYSITKWIMTESWALWEPANLSSMDWNSCMQDYLSMMSELLINTESKQSTLISRSPDYRIAYHFFFLLGCLFSSSYKVNTLLTSDMPAFMIE